MKLYSNLIVLKYFIWCQDIFRCQFQAILIGNFRSNNMPQFFSKKNKNATIVWNTLLYFYLKKIVLCYYYYYYCFFFVNSLMVKALTIKRREVEIWGSNPHKICIVPINWAKITGTQCFHYLLRGVLCLFVLFLFIPHIFRIWVRLDIYSYMINL